MDLAEPLRRGQQARTRTVVVAASEPLLGNRLGRRATPLQLFRQLPVVGASPSPRCVVIDGLADQVMSKRSLMVHLHQKPSLNRFIDAGCAAKRDHQL